VSMVGAWGTPCSPSGYLEGMFSGTGFLAGTSSVNRSGNPWGRAQVPLGLLEKFSILWVAPRRNVVSGTLLLIGYPYKAFTNPLFYVKLT